MRHAIRIACSVLVVAGSAAISSAQVCAGAPSFSHVTWQATIGLEFTGSGQRAGTSLVLGHDALFAGGLASVGHADGAASADWVVGATAGSDRVIHRGRRLHLCPTFKILYTFGPNQGSSGSLTEFNTFTMAAGGTLGFVASETPTHQIVPTVSLGFAHDRTWASRQNRRLGEKTDAYLTANVGIGFVFDDQHAVTPQITMAFKDEHRVTGLLILTTIGFGIR